MTKQSFIPSVNEDLNRPHNVTLTEGEISTILYNLEGTYGHLLDGEIPEEVQTIFSKLEGVVDNFYKTNDPLNITPFQEELEIKKYIRDNPT